jgi:ABC-type nitrate/sulfonate/bicarbonate transport system ATPase subunit
MIILLVGNAGCGKDSFARAIAKNVPKTEVLAFAEPIKEFGSEVMGFTQDQLFGPSERRRRAIHQGVSVRTGE